MPSRSEPWQAVYNDAGIALAGSGVMMMMMMTLMTMMTMMMTMMMMMRALAGSGVMRETSGGGGERSRGREVE